MKATMAETQLLKNIVGQVHELIHEARLTFKEDEMHIDMMDTANVAFTSVHLRSNAFVEYDPTIPEGKEALVLDVNTKDLKTVLGRCKASDTLTLSNTTDRFVLDIHGERKAQFEIPLLDVGEDEQKRPDLKFPVTIRMPVEMFEEAVEDAAIVGESLYLVTNEQGELRIGGKSDLSSAQTTLQTGDDLSIEGADEERQSKYSIEYVKRSLTKHCGPKVTVQYNRDYPCLLSYDLPDKLAYSVIIAPRLDSD